MPHKPYKPTCHKLLSKIIWGIKDFWVCTSSSSPVSTYYLTFQEYLFLKNKKEKNVFLWIYLRSARLCNTFRLWESVRILYGSEFWVYIYVSKEAMNFNLYKCIRWMCSTLYGLWCMVIFKGSKAVCTSTFSTPSVCVYDTRRFLLLLSCSCENLFTRNTYTHHIRSLEDAHTMWT